MLNQLEIFKNREFGEIRTVTIDGEPWFVGKDIAEALGYSNTRDALATQRWMMTRIPSIFWTEKEEENQNQVIINESGVYALIFVAT